MRATLDPMMCCSPKTGGEFMKEKGFVLPGDSG